MKNLLAISGGIREDSLLDNTQLSHHAIDKNVQQKPKNKTLTQQGKTR